MHTAADHKCRTSRTAERRASRPEKIDPGQVYSVREACAALDISRAYFYRMVASDRIKIVRYKEDGWPRIPGAEILRLSRSYAPEQAPG